ncbi:uncharacterized protein LOC129339518 [Eublepharis macularius]|uniref:Uncharacterized protein LOC129339518 n=1 Tax=Eublepharis macularius TaxID=481883 RepID=A0AA97K7T8_EUBMA|nr:uncharacterized protein LOC129339518 [Eublepharis macularius]
MATCLRYPGKVVIVTGGTGGIGLASVREFVRQGAKVVFCSQACGAERGQAIQRELQDSGCPGEAFYQVCDVTNEADIQRLILVTIERYGCLDCLVNTAADGETGTIDDVTAEDFRNHMEINVVSCLLTSKYALPYLRETRGNIINIGSLRAVIGGKNVLSYASSKGAVIAMTKALAIDESKYGVRVNCLSPGNIWIPLWEKYASQSPDPEATIREAECHQLLGRIGTAEEAALGVLYLAADGTFCTGFNLVISGGAEVGFGTKEVMDPQPGKSAAIFSRRTDFCRLDSSHSSGRCPGPTWRSETLNQLWNADSSSSRALARQRTTSPSILRDTDLANHMLRAAATFLQNQLDFGPWEAAARLTADMAAGLRYSGKVAVVTGGTSGIGLAIVKEFVLQGARVVFCAPGSEEERGRAIQKELQDSGSPGKGYFLVCDVRNEVDIKALILATIECYGRLDCLVNNAGGHPPDQTIDDVSAQEFRSLMDLNVVSCFLASKFALPYLRETRGNIINIASLVGSIGQKYAVPYVATKGAVTAMTKAMAIDESKYGVRVNSISPGNIWTPLWENLASQTANLDAAIQEGSNAQLLGRFGTSAEVAAAALYLAADGTFCTGIDLVLSGGAELGYAKKNLADPSLACEG